MKNRDIEIIEFYVKKRRNGRLYIAGNNIAPQGQVSIGDEKAKETQKKKKTKEYKIVPISVFCKNNNLDINTPQDSDMSTYFNDVKKAKREDEQNIARTYVVTDLDGKNALGYYTLRVTCLKCKDDFFIGTSKAYEGCDAHNDGYFPVIELLMFAKNYNDNFKVQMKDVFFNDIAKKIFKIYQEVGIVYLYLECSKDNIILKDYYSQTLKLMPFPDDFGILEKHNLVGFIQRIEFIRQ